MQKFLNYKTFGDKANEPVLIIHGLFGSLDNWLTISKKWSEVFYVIIVDVRNHGRSFHSEDMSFESLSQDIYLVLQEEGVNKINLLGHSMGGKIAMDFAGFYPDLLNKLIIVDVAPFKYGHHHADVIRMLEEVRIEDCTNRGDVESEIRGLISTESVVQFMSKNVKRNTETLKFEWKFNKDVLIREYSYLIERLPNRGFKGETLFIGGGNSNYITKETSVHIFDLYSNCEIEYIKDAGHWVHAENPTDLYQLVLEFIKEKVNDITK